VLEKSFLFSFQLGNYFWAALAEAETSAACHGAFSPATPQPLCCSFEDGEISASSSYGAFVIGHFCPITSLFLELLVRFLRRSWYYRVAVAERPTYKVAITPRTLAIGVRATV
jgi:hypothetical protein